MDLEAPSSKAVVSFVTLFAVGSVAYIETAGVIDYDVPPWLFLASSVAGALVVYWKRENRPSSSAQASLSAKVGGSQPTRPKGDTP